jgi:hypothetical protein
MQQELSRRRAWSIKEFSKEKKIGRDTIYDAIRDGRLIARKLGRRTIILDDEGEEFLKSLPKLELKGPRHRFGRSSKTASDVSGNSAASPLANLEAGGISRDDHDRRPRQSILEKAE